MLPTVRAALVIALAVAGTGLAHADSGLVCGDRDALVSELGNRFAERRAAIALTSVGQMVEVFASSDGSWTLLLTPPDGPSCVAAAGESWQVLPVTTVAKPAI